MRAKPGSGLALIILLGLVVRSHESRADFAQCSAPLSACTATSSGCCTATFTMTSGTYHPLIIPMDRCHQPIGSGSLGPPGSGAPRTPWTISTISRTTTKVLVKLSTTHTIADGEAVRVAGTGVSDFNGTFAAKTGNGCTIGSAGGNKCNGDEIEYSTTTSGSASATTGKVLSHNLGNGWCADAVGTQTRIGGNAADDGMLKTYGLIYRLMQRAIPVYWLVNPGKTALALNASQNASSQTYIGNDIDLWILASGVSAPPVAGASLTACSSGCTQPVHRLDETSLTPKTDSYQFKEFPMRGGAFLIAAEDRAKFDDFWKRQGAYSTLSATKYNWSASGIDLYEIDGTAQIAYQDFTSGEGITGNPYSLVAGAPLSVKIDYEPPRIACVGCTSAVAQSWLGTAGIQDPAATASCSSGEFVPSDATYCVLNDTDVAQGTLVSGGFGWLWLFGYNDNSPCGNSAEKAVFDKVRDFMTSIPAIRNAGHGVFLDDSVKVAEGCPNKQLLGFQQSTSDGLDVQTNGNSEPFILRYPSNVFLQFGDLAPASASGTVKGWKYYKSGTPTLGYQTALAATGSSLRRLMTVDTTGTNNDLCLEHVSTTACDSFTPSAGTGDLHDVATYGRLNNLLNNGLAYYLSGNQLDNSGNYGELRMLLNSLLALPDETFTSSPTIVEVSRSGPIVATDASSVVTVFQGTYEHFDPIPNIPKAVTSAGLARFTFPYTLGHLRQIPVASYVACGVAGCDTGNGSRTQIASLSGVIFDAADHIPPVSAGGCANNFNGSCRTVFTTLQSGRLPPHVMFTTANYAATTTSAPADLGTTLASNFTTTEKQTLISRILAGRLVSGSYVPKLGGIDRSTVAVIEPSNIAGSAGRPTMAYVGATDGMMHAFCVTTGGGCDEVGRELWAYIPRTVIPDLRQSTAHIDGSPNVIDAFGDFDNNGSNAWHTILIFHTGTGRMTANNVVPAVYAIDVTTPNSPRVLWEYAVTAVGSRGANEMGVGLNLTAGTVMISGVRKTVAYVQTQNGGTGGAASVLTAINVETGAQIWQKADIYPASRVGTHEGAPSAGIPGGAVGLDTTGTGRINKIVYGTLYGDVYVRSADTGTNQTGASSGVDIPLMRLSTDYHPIGVPPAILSKNGIQYAAFATGGYADSQSTLWRGENESPMPTQIVFAVSTSYSTSTSLTEGELDTTKLPIKFNLGAGEAGFSQLTVVGGELFVTTDNTNINDYAFGTSSTPTGHAYRYDFGATTPSQGTTLVIASGATSLFNNGTTMITGSGRYGEKLSTDAASTTGVAVDPMATANQLKRALWLRTQ